MLGTPVLADAIYMQLRACHEINEEINKWHLQDSSYVVTIQEYIYLASQSRIIL
jgi:hypothetical protein